MRLGLPDGSSEAADSTQYRAYQLIAEEFGDGANGPLLVVADAAGARRRRRRSWPRRPRSRDRALHRTTWSRVAPDRACPTTTHFLAFQVIPADGPSSESTDAARARAARSLVDRSTDGVVLGVAGQATGNIDISQKLADALPLYLGVVIGLSLLILIIVFRSMLVPLIATAGFVLSLFATLRRRRGDLPVGLARRRSSACTTRGRS